MCSSVWIPGKDDADCWAVSELREFCPEIVFNKLHLEYTPDLAELDEDQCLCCVDLPATAEKNGYTSEPDGDDSMRHVFRKKPVHFGTDVASSSTSPV